LAGGLWRQVAEVAARARTATIVDEATLARDEGVNTEAPMGMGRGILLWLLGIPLPIIILLALFWR
jgi:hypothetical protein